MLDAEAYFEWAERTDAGLVARTLVGNFIALLAEKPYAYPSVPITEDSELPVYETREAIVLVSEKQDVWIRYIHVYATDDVVILDVRSNS